jgi:hypothetical protein
MGRRASDPHHADMRKLLRVVAFSAAIVIGTAGPAFAHSCANVSRPAPTNDTAGGQGLWFYLDVAQAWVFEMPDEGSLLEGSAHCTGDGVPQADKVYWNWTADSTPHGIVTGCGEAP